MNVIIKRAGEERRMAGIANDLRQMQAIVEGPLEVVRIDKDLCLICNEEGQLRGLKPNFVLGDVVIVGNVFFVRAFQDDFINLDIDDVKLIDEILTKGILN